jgi:hypothetical protein
MKNLYTLVGALAISSMAVGQLMPVNHNVNAKSATFGKAEANDIVSRKGTPLWSNDLSVPGDWTINNDAGNSDDWVIGTAIPSGAFAIAGIISTTAANGFGLFDSDLLCSGTQDANLQITNSFDLSSAPSAKIEFEQFYRRYQGNSYVEVSTDGSTWTQYEVNDTYGVNDASATNSELVSVNISGSTQSSATVWIRFKYTGGCDYAWMVDDINIWEAPDNDLALNGIAYASATVDGYSGNYITYHNYPISQISPVHFAGYSCNVGGTAQNGVMVDVAVPSEGFTASSAAMTQTAGNCDTIQVAADWTPTPAVGVHPIDFSLTYDSLASDADPSNNTGSALVGVSVGDYETFPSEWTGSGLWNGDDGNGITTAYEMGNQYQFPANTTIEAITAVISSSTDVGVLIYAALYSVDLITGDFTYVDQSSDFTVTAADLAATGPDAHRMIFPLPTPQPVIAGEQYLVCIGHYGGTEGLTLANGNGPVAEQTVFLLDGADNTWYYLGSNPMVGIMLPGSVLGVDGEVATEAGIQLYQNTPNPFNGVSTINYELPQAGQVTFEVFDVTGKQIVEMNEGNKGAGSYQVSLNAADFAAGAYYYTLTVGAERVSKKMVITK